jgi:hypothetical protein
MRVDAIALQDSIPAKAAIKDTVFHDDFLFQDYELAVIVIKNGQI